MHGTEGLVNPMRDRLIELINDVVHHCHAGALADYLIENGVIVPPCKVGDIVWIRWGIHESTKKIYPVKVYALRYDTKKNNMRLCVEANFEITDYGGCFNHHYIGTFPWNSVGKTVFLTREEAEQALKGGAE